jgi:pentatricopeptide repeat protein
MEYNATVAPDATTYNTLMAGYASRSMWTAMDKLIGRMRDAGVRPDEYTYGPILEAARRIGQRQRARSYGRRMLLDSEIALSPFCLNSLRRSLGLSQLRALVDELPGVSWEGVEAALVRYDEDKGSGGAGGGDRGRRRGKARALGSTGKEGAAGMRGESAEDQGGVRNDVEVDD